MKTEPELETDRDTKWGGCYTVSASVKMYLLSASKY